MKLPASINPSANASRHNNELAA
ncbi:hypothetical protein D046_8388, partial [Vibrio parahaemolyticus V-223/04]